MGPGDRVFSTFVISGQMPSGSSVNERKGLRKLICSSTKILKIGPKLRELWPCFYDMER